ncbi:hypothetical protein BLA29_005540, partial [Euroglyphus maynei]
MFGISSNKLDFDQKINRNINIAKLFFQNKDYNSAKNFINELLELRPDSSEAYKLLSQINEALGENEMAMKNYQKSLELKSAEANNFFANDQSAYQSPSRLRTISNRLISTSPKSKNGPNKSQNSSTTTVTLDSDVFKMIENLIESKFSTLINSIQMMNKDQTPSPAQNNAQAIIMLK